MSEVPVCAHMCPVLADAIADAARGTGVTERVGRVARGLTPEYLPLTVLAHPSRRPLPARGVTCPTCGRTCTTLSAARRCADLDTGTTD